MNELTSYLTNLTNIAIWILIGPLFGVILFHLGEKRWGNGPTWAWLGLLFNVFALLYYLLLAGYESNESRSTGALEAQRVRKLLDATRDWKGQQKLEGTVEGAGATGKDPYIDDLLAAHRPADALSYARERYNVAFQTGDRASEEVYGGYVARIVEQDEQLRAKLAELQQEHQA